MSQKDLGLKIAMRKHLWRLGYSTRINVPLRAYTPQLSQSQSKYEEFTDLDVLGVAIGRDVRVETVIGDCKTTEKGSTERMFWLRGVADYFETDTTYLVRQADVTRAARQLANRLNISIIVGNDFKTLEDFHQNDPRHDWNQLNALLSAENVQREDTARASLSGNLANLLDYLKNDYWAYDQYRNLFQTVAHLSDAATDLEPENPFHLAIVLDCAWHFALSASRAVAYIRRVHIAEVSQTLQEYVFGGQLGFREKRNLYHVIRKLAPSNTVAVEILPPYYQGLLDVVTRLLRRPDSINSILRYAELLRVSLYAKSTAHLKLIFGDTFDDLSAKLLTDVVNFLCSASSIDVRLRNNLRDIINPASRAPDKQPASGVTTVTTESGEAVANVATIAPRNYPGTPSPSSSEKTKREGQGQLSPTSPIENSATSTPNDSRGSNLGTPTEGAASRPVLERSTVPNGEGIAPGDNIADDKVPVASPTLPNLTDHAT